MSAAKVRESYRKSKARLSSALKEGQKKSYGVREEHRISLLLFRQIRDSLTAAGTWEQPPRLMLAQYSFWELPSDSYTTFLQYNANKFLYATERALASAPDGSLSYERAKVITMLLESAKYCYDTSPLAREAGLWRDRYQVHSAGRHIQGIGLKRTIEESGYGWF